MKIEYKVEEQDFLDFQLFNASISDKINNKKKNGRVLLTFVFQLAAVYFYVNESFYMTIYFVVISLISILFYSKYFIWRYTKHYKTYVNDNYSTRFGQLESIEITDEFIYSKDKTGEGKIKVSAVEKVDETNNHFFLKISNGLFVIVPKSGMENVSEFRDKLIALHLMVNNYTDWKWR